MKRAVVTTTINPPTKALKKFAEIGDRDGWDLIIVGDKKTPHGEYMDFCDKYECATYLDCDAQELISKELSKLIGWNCIQRRNFGFIYAYKMGAEIIATIDDDNIPYDSWGQNVRVGKTEGISIFKTKCIAFDPLSVTFPALWHRGFPVQLLDERILAKPQLLKRKILVQADMWDGAPDVDAVCRITLNPMVTFNKSLIHYASNVAGPFNSQNTFISRELFPIYFLFPHIGRMDDIWASYVVQTAFPDSVIYSKASVFQDRNPHDLTKDLGAEMIGYNHTLDLIKALALDGELEEFEWPDFMPKKAIEAYVAYAECFE